MIMDNFICYPLSWNEEDPVKLVSLYKESSDNLTVTCTHKFFSKDILCLEFKNKICFEIQILDEVSRKSWENMGVIFLGKSDLDINDFSEIYQSAIKLISVFPSLESTINCFAKKIIIVGSEYPEVDISLSDPRLPFTIFLSIPDKKEKNRVERFAEGIIHESLHLQLTAIENEQPLLINEKLRHDVFSPWKGEGRNERGLLHAVYVFSCLFVFWSQIAKTSCASRDFAKSRCLEIKKQLSSSHHLLTYPSLTSSAKNLSNICLNC